MISLIMLHSGKKSNNRKKGSQKTNSAGFYGCLNMKVTFFPQQETYETEGVKAAVN